MIPPMSMNGKASGEEDAGNRAPRHGAIGSCGHGHRRFLFFLLVGATPLDPLEGPGGGHFLVLGVHRGEIDFIHRLLPALRLRGGRLVLEEHDLAAALVLRASSHVVDGQVEVGRLQVGVRSRATASEPDSSSIGGISKSVSKMSPFSARLGLRRQRVLEARTAGVVQGQLELAVGVGSVLSPFGAAIELDRQRRPD